MINDRVKELRKELNLTMEKFGERLGVKKNSISQIESGNRNLTEQMFLAICREFGVNEEWLRDGEGEMFVEPVEFSLDDFCKKRGMSELELGILKAFFNIPQEIRKQALDYFVEGFQELDLNLPVLKDKKASLEDLYRATGVNDEEENGTGADAKKQAK